MIIDKETWFNQYSVTIHKPWSEVAMKLFVVLALLAGVVVDEINGMVKINQTVF